MVVGKDNLEIQDCLVQEDWMAMMAFLVRMDILDQMDGKDCPAILVFQVLKVNLVIHRQFPYQDPKATRVFQVQMDSQARPVFQVHRDKREIRVNLVEVTVGV